MIFEYKENYIGQKNKYIKTGFCVYRINDVSLYADTQQIFLSFFLSF